MCGELRSEQIYSRRLPTKNGLLCSGLNKYDFLQHKASCKRNGYDPKDSFLYSPHLQTNLLIAAKWLKDSNKLSVIYSPMKSTSETASAFERITVSLFSFEKFTAD